MNLWRGRWAGGTVQSQWVHRLSSMCFHLSAPTSPLAFGVVGVLLPPAMIPSTFLSEVGIFFLCMSVQQEAGSLESGKRELEACVCVRGGVCMCVRAPMHLWVQMCLCVFLCVAHVPTCVFGGEAS